MSRCLYVNISDILSFMTKSPVLIHIPLAWHSSSLTSDGMIDYSFKSRPNLYMKIQLLQEKDSEHVQFQVTAMSSLVLFG